MTKPRAPRRRRPDHLTLRDEFQRRNHWAYDLRLAIGPTGSNLVSYDQVIRTADELANAEQTEGLGANEVSHGKRLSRETIRDHLAARSYPSPRRAWLFGRVLNLLGLKSYCGPRQLIVAGHLRDFLGVMARYYFSDEQNVSAGPSSVLHLVKRLRSAEYNCIGADLAQALLMSPNVARLAVEGPDCPHSLAKIALAELGQFHTADPSRVPAPSALERYRRARDGWITDDTEQQGFEKAWAAWLDTGTAFDTSDIFFDVHFNNALAMANNREHAYHDRVWTVVAFLSQSLSSLLSEAEKAEIDRYLSYLNGL